MQPDKKGKNLVCTQNPEHKVKLPDSEYEAPAT
jgi:hypothetical protein